MGTTTAEIIPGVRSRLSYPLGYWNGLAALMALGIPLMMWAACCVSKNWIRSFAGATVPLLSLTLFFTLSRGGTLAAIVGLVTLFALFPSKRRLAITGVIVAVASALCIIAATGRQQLMDGRAGALATSQGWEVLVVVLVACAMTAVLLAFLPLAERRIQLPEFRLANRGRRVLISGFVLSILFLAIALIVSGRASDLWQEFKAPEKTPSSSSRLDAASGNGRYQYWSSAIKAAGTEPVLGIGPGAFEFWWDREGTLEGSVRDAHSLYLESLAELGIPGLLLVLGLIATPIAVASRKAIDIREGNHRGAYAAASAAMSAFAIAAAVDWIWELAVLPACFFLVAAAVTGGATRLPPKRARAEWRFGCCGRSTVVRRRH